MKNRRFALIAFLLCATLIVSVGYAAVTEQLTIDGTASYHMDTLTGLEGKVHYTGNVLIVDNEHAEVTNNDALIIDVTSGSQTATIDANFTSANVQVFHSDSQYLAGIILEVEIDNTQGTEALNLTFGEIAVQGEIGDGKPFTVVSYVKDGQTNAAVTVTELSVAAGDKDTVYLHVRLSMLESIVSGNVTEVADTTFKVVLPVNKVEAVGA